MKTNGKTAVAYLRTSSQTNVDGDSHARQLVAIQAYARSAGIEIIATFTDDAVKGADAIESRPGFASMMELLLSNGTRCIIVETASRFARDLITQEVGFEMLKARGIELIAADKPDAFLDDGPTAVLVRQMLGAVAQFEKAMLVSKLKGSRDRKSAAAGGRIEGRKSHAEKHPHVVALAKQLRRKLPKGGQRSYVEIANELAAAGHLNSNGVAFSKSSVKSMLEG